MDSAFIQKLIDLHERSNMVELEYIQGDKRIRLTKTSTAGVRRPTTQGEQALGAEEGLAAAASVAPIAHPVVKSRALKAALSGIFHRRPSPSEPPYVNEGDLVQEGQIVGVLEAMKVLNGIESECSGRLVEVLVEDGACVELGTDLFRIEPLGTQHV